MYLFLAGIPFILTLVALVVWVYSFFRQRDIPLLIASGVLVFFTWKIVFEIPRILSLPRFGLDLDISLLCALGSLVVGILGILRSLKGLMVTILKSDSVLDSWNYIVEQGAGRGDFVLGTTERLLVDAHMPGVTTSKEPIAIGCNSHIDARCFICVW